MPILKAVDAAVPVPFEPRTVASEVRSTIIDTRYNPLASLLTHISGASWIVDYYAQILDNDDEVRDLQVTGDVVYQQYQQIKSFELKVTDPLSQQQDAQSQAFDITGGAVIYPSIIPNKGDAFVADIGDGQLGVFTVLTTSKKTIYKDACYEITYQLTSYLDDTYRAALANKTVKSTTFVKDQLYFGQSPVLMDSDAQSITTLRKGYSNLVAHYFGDFHNIELNTLLVPNQVSKTYDPYLTSAIMQTLDQSVNAELLKIRVLNVDRDPEFRRPSVWKCLVEMSYDLLPMCFYAAGTVPVIKFAELAEFNGVYYSGVCDVVYPMDHTTLIPTDGISGIYYNSQSAYVDPFVPGRITPGDLRVPDVNQALHPVPLANYEGDPNGVGEARLPDIHPITKDDYYVFSSAFYLDTPTEQSKLEKLTLETLRGEPVNKATLGHLVTSAKNWNNLERFYYIPVLLILIKMALRDY